MDSMQQAFSVVLVLALLGCTLWWLRRKGMAQLAFRTPAGKRKSIQVIERLALTPHHSLHLVKVSGRMMLIAASPAGCSILEGFTEPVSERVEIR
jgi:flagellar biogenesis protein FliO